MLPILPTFRRWEDEKRWAFHNLPKEFTNLPASGFELDDVTSPHTIRYNCIAYAAKDESQPWWPMPPNISTRYYYWPDELPREYPATVPNFVRAFESLGFSVCSSGKHEAGFEKVAIYVDSNNIPTHMSRELGDGIWQSKLGDCQDIRHHDLHGVETASYGKAKYFMKKRLEGYSSLKRFALWVRQLVGL